MAAVTPEAAGDGEEGKHLIILLHGMFGAAADWENWIRVWNAEVQRRTGVAPQAAAKHRGRHRLRRRLFQCFHTRPAVPTPARETPAIYPVPTHWGRSLRAEFCVVELRNETLKGIMHQAIQSCLQVESFLSRQPGQFTCFSIIGHSFGGIFSKGLLSIRHLFPHFAALRPMNFIALATPHLSSCSTVPRAPFEIFGRHLLSTSGKELLLQDAPLQLLVSTCASVPHLQKFVNLMAYMNVQEDLLVAYGTGIIQLQQGIRMPTCTTNGKVVVGVHYPDRCRCFGDSSPFTTSLSSSQQSSQCGEGDSEPDELELHHISTFHIDRGFMPIAYPAHQVALDKRVSHERPPGPLPHPRVRLTAREGASVRALFAALAPLPWSRVDVRIPDLRAHEFLMLKHAPKSRTELNEIVVHVFDHFVF